ncbi:hypothetical protein [Labilibaculum euxinus]
MKLIFTTLIIAITLFGCAQALKVVVVYSKGSIVIENKQWNLPLKIESNHELFGAFSNRQPDYCIDTLMEVVYINIPYQQVEAYSLNTKSKLSSIRIDSAVMPHERDFELKLIDKGIIFSSNERIWFLDHQLNLKTSFLDTIRDKYKEYHFFDYSYTIKDDTIRIEMEFDMVGRNDAPEGSRLYEKYIIPPE